MHGTNASTTIDVLIVDDSADLAAMVARLLGTERDMRVVGTLNEAGPLPQKVAELRPRVVLLDLSMPGVPPLVALRESRDACKALGTRIVAFSGHDDPATEAEAIAAGAWCLLSKGDDPIKLIETVRKVAQA